MDQETSKWIRRMQAGVIFALVFGGTACVRADTSKASAAAKTAVRDGWGEPKDGLQIGLFSQSSQKAYRYGDTVSLLFRARNVTNAPIEFMMRPPDITTVTLGESGRLVLQTLGGHGDAVSFRLAPGQTAELPGGRYAAQIIAPAEKPEGAENAPALALLPGTYHAECNTPIWMPDKNDASSATGHRAKPGLFTFTVTDPARRIKQSPPKADKTPHTPIVWGEAISGIQGGLLRVTEKDLARLPADKRKDIPADEIPVLFYVRNTLDKPLSIAYHNFLEDDCSPWVKNAKGDALMVQTVFTTGFHSMQNHTLQPGEILQAGWGRIKFQTADTPREANDYTPMLTAEPGAYTLQLISSVRFAGLSGFDLTLISGAVPFAIPPR